MFSTSVTNPNDHHLATPLSVRGRSQDLGSSKPQAILELDSSGADEPTIKRSRGQFTPLDPESPISTLPDEILSHVFSFLKTRDLLIIHRVCKRWRLVLEEVHCASLDFSRLRVHLNDTRLKSVAERFAAVESLRLTGCILLTKSGFTCTSSCQLRSLSLTNCPQVTDSILEAITIKYTLLEFVNVSNCSQLSPVGIRQLARCRKLKKLSIAFCTQVDDQSLLILVTGCKRIQSLNLYCCSLLTIRTLQAIADNSTNISQLNLNHCTSIIDDFVNLKPQAAYVSPESHGSLHDFRITLQQMHGKMVEGSKPLMAIRSALRRAVSLR